jgi:hypothetical protein
MILIFWLITEVRSSAWFGLDQEDDLHSLKDLHATIPFTNNNNNNIFYKINKITSADQK